MIPYLHVPVLSIDRISVDAEAVLSATGLLFAILISRRRARRFGIQLERLSSFTAWILAGALVGGHWADVVCYHFDEIADFSDGHILWNHPWKLLCLWDGWRSVGGFFGAFLGSVLWRAYLFQVTDWFRFSAVTKLEGYWFVRRARAEPILQLSDIALSVFPVAWVFNRTGAALVHDHPGTRASVGSLLAVEYPDLNSPPSIEFGLIHGSVPRYDLGLLELLVTLVLVVAVVATWNRRLRAGTYVCLAGLTYPPARFALDFLRRRTGSAADPIFAELTPAQWGFATLFLLSVVMFLWIWIRPIDTPIRA